MSNRSQAKNVPGSMHSGGIVTTHSALAVRAGGFRPLSGARQHLSPRHFPQTLLRNLSLALSLLLVAFGLPALLHAQNTTGSISGTVEDQTGGVISNATVTLIDQATQTTLVTRTNATGFFTFPNALPATYTVKITAKGFQATQLTELVLHAGAQLMIPPFKLNVGAATQTVTVQATAQMIPVDNGAREAVLSAKDISNLALEGRDTTELLKVLPGAVTEASGLTQNAPAYSDINISVNQSAVGTGINLNGVPARGGTELLSDGVDVLDPGDEASSISIISPEMTQEVSVQTSNFGAESQYGPVVISAISKSGGAHYHGEAYFDARNDVLNANGWLQNHQHQPLAGAAYYYPGGNIGGPVPGMGHKLFFWGGVEFLRQNQGNANYLQSYVPSPAMLAGDFTSDNPANNILCPNGFSPTVQGQWCNSLNNTVLPGGGAPTPAAAGQTGAYIPAGAIDPASKALSSFWPNVWNSDGTPNPAGGYSNPATTPGGYDYYRTIINVNNGWIWRARVDYDMSSKTHFFLSYQQAYSAELAQGNGAHIYWTPGNAIPFPGGGVYGDAYTKALSGHFLHTFGPTATNDFIAAWGYGNFPFTVPNLSAAYKSTTGYPTSYGQPYNTGSLLIPSYSSAGTNTFPDFSQNDIFENPLGQYEVRKEVPSFADTFTKVWGSHTIKLGAFTQNTGNIQSNDGTYINGDITSFSGQNPNYLTHTLVGSPLNPNANFDMGVVTGYQQQSAAPVSDMAYQTTAAFVDDSWKVSNRLNVEFGARFEHVGHWYDRQGVGMAVFEADRVLPDFYSGKIDPGYYWHAIDPGIPTSGQPTRLMFVSPRFGFSYDLLGSGKTVLRGGWGAYRFTGQYNDYAAALTTAQNVQSVSLQGGESILLSQLAALAPTTPVPPTCTYAAGATVPTCTVPVPGSTTGATMAAPITGSQNGLDPNDYGEPLTYAYNLTIDQRLPWNSLLDIAYVGNHTNQLLDVSESIEGSDFTALGDQNKMPEGALFKPDPRTGVLALNPENVTQQPTTGTMTGNTYADYHPYGYAYGTNTAVMAQSIDYANYNGLQATWLKSAGRLTYDFNFTWSKALGTALQENPYNVNLNYGPEATDRPFVFNSSYTYQTGNLHTGNRYLNGAAGGWTISGISTWQAGGYLPTLLGNSVPNFGLTEAYDPSTIPAAAAANGVNTNIGDPTYFGTDESGLPIMPVLTCNPNSNLAKYQRVQLGCFSAPAVGTNGGQKYPYMSMGSYFDNDLAVYKTFHIHNDQNIQIRASAFDWLNHPLPDFSSSNQVTLRYLVNYTTKAITLNTNPNGGTSPTFGYMDSKTAYPYSRILELDATYHF